MKVKNFFEDEKGAALPLVTIILGLFVLGFIVLVVDVGTLYVERKAMVTAADAAALAGAQILRVSKGVNMSEAELAAKNYVIANGGDANKVEVFVGNKQVTIPSGTTENRQVVEVTVGKNKKLLFARFLGDDNTDVKAHAIATWGYVYKSYMWQFIPLFIFDNDYKLDINILLHDKVEDTNSYGFIDIGGGMNNIKAALAGEKVEGIYVEQNLLQGKPGQGDSLRLGVESRMIKAQGKDTAEERRKTMIGLIPIIDKEAFLDIPTNLDKNANKYQLPIKYFAYFEIIDVIKKNGVHGSDEALDSSNEYKKVISVVDYSTLLGGENAEYTFISGRFTGEIVDARTIVEIGDQIDPNPGGDTPATYSKLIK